MDWMDGSWIFSGNVRKEKVRGARDRPRYMASRCNIAREARIARVLRGWRCSVMSPLLLFLVIFSRCYVPGRATWSRLGRGFYMCMCVSWMASLKATSPHACLVGSSFFFLPLPNNSSGCFVIASACTEPTERFWLLLAARMGSGSCCSHTQGVSPCEPV